MLAKIAEPDEPDVHVRQVDAHGGDSASHCGLRLSQNPVMSATSVGVPAYSRRGDFSDTARGVSRATRYQTLPAVHPMSAQTQKGKTPSVMTMPSPYRWRRNGESPKPDANSREYRHPVLQRPISPPEKVSTASRIDSRPDTLIASAGPQQEPNANRNCKRRSDLTSESLP